MEPDGIPLPDNS